VSAPVSAESRRQLVEDIGRFGNDPLGFVRYAFPWGRKGTDLEKHGGPRQWQVDVLDSIGQQLRDGAKDRGEVIREAVASGHGIGKSALVSMLVLWALATMPDTRGVVTANTDTQLRTKTWPEVAKWHRLSLVRDWFVHTATALYSTAPGHEKNWRIDAVPWSEHNTEAFAGLHNEGRRLLLIFDEASAIADKVWEVAEGALSDEGTEIIWAAFGNATRASGRFRECFRKLKHRWRTRQIDSRTVEGTNKVELQKLVDDHGEDSDVVKVRVRGIFPNLSMRQFIAEADVDAAFGRHLRPEQYSFAPVVLTCDPAWQGDDALVIAKRQGLMFEVLRTLPKNDDDVFIASLLANLEVEHGATAVHIDMGYGTGIVSAGRAMGRDWRLVPFGGASPDPGYKNMRAYMWGQMRDWLKQGGALPPDSELRDELLSPEVLPRLDGVIVLESKQDMKDRGLPSPNKADALALSFAYPIPSKGGNRPMTAAETGADYDPYN
jgi:hypothetical protein